ncbi:MAG TPA: TonB-dependent receptor [Vicinamibacterales bacterium]|nr:TonB-dependent receptor [Vicinamibacterales bacterium]
MARRIRPSILAASIWIIVLVPANALAQSAIAGVVKDPSGAVLPGVTVEASSDVLIEKTRTVVTNGQGQYLIVDLRPGTYSLSFTLTGFSGLKRDRIELPANFTATINAELKIGALEESVTVSGESPVVDVQSAARTTVLSRETLDSIPTGRTIQSVGQLVVGVTLNVPDVGGSRAMQQTYMSVHGLSSSQVTTQVDGMMVNGLDGDGAVQNYFNNMMSQEMAYQTAGAGTDVSGGGVRLNMIPKEGGNRYSGAFFGAWSDGAWQSDNLSQSLKDRGLSVPDKISKIYDFNASFGGPLSKDRLWFFTSARRWGVDAPIADTYYTPPGSNYSTTYPLCTAKTIACEQGIDDQHIKSAMVRLTWQVSPKNKLGLYYDRVGKDRGHGMTAGDDPATASQIWTSPNYSTGSVKWTSTATSKLLIESGYSFNIERYNITNQPGIDQERGTAAWYAGASRRDLNLGTHYASLDTRQGQYPDRYNLQGAASYVTGAHNIKAGAQWNWGPYRRTRTTNADLIQRYLTGVPNSVQIYNTPIDWTDRLNADLGVFAQDAWTLQRLTVNFGARWEYFNSEVSASSSPAGRFVPTRTFDAIPMPVWKDLAPRFGVVYDVFGNAKTALKFGINRFEQAQTINFADQFNPLVLTNATLSWTDLNHDDVAQGELGCTYLTAGCEINFAQMPQNFGVRALVSPNPDIKRVYNVETTLGVQHELVPGVQLNAGWFHREFHNLPRQTNTLQSFSDYTLVNVVSPLDGSLIPMYNVSRAALTRVNNVVSTDDSQKEWYNGYEISFNARLPHGATLFGGTTSERMLWTLCNEESNPNNLLYCDARNSGIPFRTQLKLSGSYPLPYGVTVSGSFQSIPGYLLGCNIASCNIPSPTALPNVVTPPGAGTVWLITPASRYAADCMGPCTPGALVIPNMSAAQLNVPLVPPGTEYAERVNQLDVSLAKWFQIGKTRVQGQLDIFNALNRGDVLSMRSLNYLTPSYMQPSSVLQGRIFRLATQLKF